MNITFWGATRQVTGSMHMLTLQDGYTILVDCGLDYEDRNDFDANNRNFPFLPEEIDLVVLTHAHIDHSGNLPNLVRQGYRGQILCTDATIELTRNLLIDSFNVQQIENNKKRNIRKGKQKMKKVRLTSKQQQATLYNRAHVEETHEAMVGISFYKPFEIREDLTLEFFEAGHILGAASAKFTVTENGVKKTIGFTGDLGNYKSKLVKDPQPMTGIDYLVTESTYGGRLHSDLTDAEAILLDYITNTCVKFKGKLVIPAFSVGRTQSIIFTFNQLYVKGLLPDVKIFTDSPLAIRTTKLYAQHINNLNDEARDFYNQHGNLFSFPGLYSIENSNDSDLISTLPEPAVIISAAGMVEGGRIQEHVRNNISDPYSTILIAGYCAEGTLGYELLQGKPTVKINKRDRQVYAKVARTDAFSAHPDQNGLMHYFEALDFKKLKRIFLVHGDMQGMTALKERIGLPNVELPEAGQVYEL
jgi:metallo-beta-lactamase family protein